MPKVMLIELRKVTDTIPTITQLNNYLKKLRRGNEGQLGTRICIKDFKDMYEVHKNIPEHENQMFVSDLFTDCQLVNGELVSNFRIFFTTKKLLSFTLHVSIFIKY